MSQYGSLQKAYLGQIKSDYFNTYFGQGYLQPWYTCFCRDGCPAEKEECGACKPQQLCNRCNMEKSAWCPSWNVNSGLGWIN